MAALPLVVSSSHGQHGQNHPSPNPATIPAIPATPSTTTSSSSSSSSSVVAAELPFGVKRWLWADERTKVLREQYKLKLGEFKKVKEDVEKDVMIYLKKQGNEFRIHSLTMEESMQMGADGKLRLVERKPDPVRCTKGLVQARFATWLSAFLKTLKAAPYVLQKEDFGKEAHVSSASKQFMEILYEKIPVSAEKEEERARFKLVRTRPAKRKITGPKRGKKRVTVLGAALAASSMPMQH